MSTRHHAENCAALERARGLAAQGNSTAAFIEVKRIAGTSGQSAATLLEAAQMFAALGHTPEATNAYIDAGVAFMEREADLEAAHDAFLAAHQLDNQNLDVVFRLAQVDVHAGRVQEAMAKYIDVLRKSNLKHVPALYDTGCIYQSQGQHDQAILAFKKILDRDRRHVQALVHMGQLHQTKGMLPEAVGFYIQAAEISREQQQIDVARGLLGMVLQLEPGFTRARFMLDDIRETYGEGAEAGQAPAMPDAASASAVVADAEAPPAEYPTEAADEETPAEATPATALAGSVTQPARASNEFAQLAAEAELAAAREDAEDARRELDALRAQMHAERELFEARIAEVKSALRATEERMQVIQETAHERTLAELAEVAEAEVRLHELQRLADDEEARLEGLRADWAASTETLKAIEERIKRADAEAMSREEAIATLERRADEAQRRVATVESDVAAQIAAVERAKSELAALRAEVDAAAAQRNRVEQVLELAGGAQAVHDDVALGKALVAKQEFERAAEAFARALELNANDAEAAYQLGVLHAERLSDPARAEALLERAIALRPEHVPAYPALALAKAKRGDVERAVDILQQLVGYDESQAPYLDYFVERLEQDAVSGDVAARYRLGVAYRELGRIEEALVVLQSIQRDHEYEVLCHNAIGLCLRRQGLDGAAAKRFTKAIETPGYPDVQYHEALYNLGDLYEARAQDNPESLALALSAFEELYASDLTFRDVSERLKQVRAALGAAENPKVKRLPQRSTDAM